VYTECCNGGSYPVYTECCNGGSYLCIQNVVMAIVTCVYRML
jgi:hypothetical protein